MTRRRTRRTAGARRGHASIGRFAFLALVIAVPRSMAAPAQEPSEPAAAAQANPSGLSDAELDDLTARAADSAVDQLKQMNL